MSYTCPLGGAKRAVPFQVVGLSRGVLPPTKQSHAAKLSRSGMMSGEATTGNGSETVALSTIAGRDTHKVYFAWQLILESSGIRGTVFRWPTADSWGPK